MEIPEDLNRLESALALQLELRSFKTPQREFSPHVTLIRKARDPGSLPPLPSVDWPVDELVLVRSNLSAAGPRYGIVARFALS